MNLITLDQPESVMKRRQPHEHSAARNTYMCERNG